MNTFSRFSAAVIIASIGVNAARAQNMFAYINPGIKLGYTFGENGGFTFGFELSYTVVPWWDIDNPPKGLIYGVSLGLDFWKQYRRVHFGAEVSTGLLERFPFFPVGICIGPSYITDNKSSDFGISIIPYIGMAGYLYYEYTFRPACPDFHEIGAYLKAPLAVSRD